LSNETNLLGPLIKVPTVSREASSAESKGYGFVIFDEFDAADAAIEAMNGQYLMNRYHNCVTLLDV